MTVDGTSATGQLSSCGTVALRNPAGVMIDLGCARDDGTMTLGPITLPLTGTYTIAVDPSARNTGSIQLRAHS